MTVNTTVVKLDGYHFERVLIRFIDSCQIRNQTLSQVSLELVVLDYIHLAILREDV